MQTVQDVVVTALAELLDLPDASQITGDTRLQEDLGIDSGLLLELFMLVEERLPEAMIDPAELKPQEFASVGRFATLISNSMLSGEAA